MKRLLLLTAALLLGSLAHSQEADDRGSLAEVTFVARAEYSSYDDECHYLGNSSFYAFVDGELSDNLSYSACLHLLGSDPAYLYQGTLRSDQTNWLDWAYLTYEFGQFSVELGKNPIKWGAFEMQKDDVDSWYELASTTWNEVVVYQWGGTLGWSPSESTYLGVQMTTSPYGEKPFGSGLWAWSLSGMWEGDALSVLGSLNSMQYDGGSDNRGNVGVRAFAGDFTFTLDNSLSFAEGAPTQHQLSACWTPSEKISLTGLAGYDRFASDLLEDRIYGGLVGCWNPFENLRVHALAAYDTWYESPLLNIGVTWRITL